MKINCNWQTCNDKCKFYQVCHLHQVSSFKLIQIDKELNWNINRLNEINRGITHYRNTLLEYNSLPLTVKKHLTKKDIQKLIASLQKEKQEIQTTISDLQRKDRNIKKILNRRLNV